MEESLHFYCDFLGFEIAFASPEVQTAEGRFSRFARLSFGAIDLMLNTAYDSNEHPSRDEERWRGHRDAALSIDCSVVDALYASILDRGVSIDPPRVAAYGKKFIEIRDPDGYGLNFRMPA